MREWLREGHKVCIGVLGTSKPDEAEKTVAYLVGIHLGIRKVPFATGAQNGVMGAVSKGAHDADWEMIGGVLRHPDSGCNPYVTQRFVCTPYKEADPYEVGMGLRTGVLMTASGFIFTLGRNSATGTLAELIDCIDYNREQWTRENANRPMAILCAGSALKDVQETVAFAFGHRERSERKADLNAWLKKNAIRWIKIFEGTNEASIKAAIDFALSNPNR